MDFNEGMADLGSAFGNFFTGNKDWERSQILNQQNMDFQREMSNTAYQRSVEDMRKAGLNPALSASSPDSTPSGSHSSYSAGSGQAGIGFLVNSALSLFDKAVDAGQSAMKLIM